MIISDRKHIVFDLEVSKESFILGTYRIEDNEEKIKINKYENSLQGFRDFKTTIQQIINSNFTFVGFNNLRYDNLFINFALNNGYEDEELISLIDEHVQLFFKDKPGYYTKFSKLWNQQITPFLINYLIILTKLGKYKDGTNWKNVIYKSANKLEKKLLWNFEYNSIDVREGSGSLKYYSLKYFNYLGYKDNTDITSDEYLIADLRNTYSLLERQRGDYDVYYSIIDNYLDSNYTGVINSPKIVGKYIKNIKLKKSIYFDSKKEFHFKGLNVYNKVGYNFGCWITNFNDGGIHYTPYNSLNIHYFKKDEDYFYYNIDATSFYPTTYLQNGMLNTDTTDILQNLFDERVKAKGKDKLKADTLKLILNTIYGQLIYHEFSKNDLTIYTQKIILDFVGNLYKEGVIVNRYDLIDVNTDGILIRTKKKLPSNIKFTCMNIKLDFECVELKEIYYKDTNNFILKFLDDTLKLKGAWVRNTRVNDTLNFIHFEYLTKCYLNNIDFTSIEDKYFICMTKRNNVKNFNFDYEYIDSDIQIGYIDLNNSYLSFDSSRILSLKSIDSINFIETIDDNYKNEIKILLQEHFFNKKGNNKLYGSIAKTKKSGKKSSTPHHNLFDVTLEKPMIKIWNNHISNLTVIVDLDTKDLPIDKFIKSENYYVEDSVFGYHFVIKFNNLEDRKFFIESIKDKDNIEYICNGSIKDTITLNLSSIENNNDNVKLHNLLKKEDDYFYQRKKIIQEPIPIEKIGFVKEVLNKKNISYKEEKGVIYAECLKHHTRYVNEKTVISYDLDTEQIMVGCFVCQGIEKQRNVDLYNELNELIQNREVTHEKKIIS